MRQAARRLGSRLTSAAAGAVVAQVWQAAGSFALQILAAHLLGASGLGTVALSYGVLILVTAVASGIVGDSLTVLDRHAPRIRAGLAGWTVLLAALGGLGTGVGLWVSGVLEGWLAPLAMGLAAALFVVEEIVRRVLMATMRFWRLVLVDTAAVVTTLTGVALAARGSIAVHHFFLALALGQLVGIVVGVGLLPVTERDRPTWRGAAYRDVLAFGGWRGLQVAVNPTALTAMRFLVMAAAGAAALGALEAARIFVAPATLVVQGLGSYLFASYARDRTAPVAVLQARASRASLGLAAGAIALGVLAMVVAPSIGHLVTGPGFAIAPMAVLAWSVYAAAIATVQPFASLAATRGRQRAVLGVRVVDSLLGLAVLAAGLGTGLLPVAATPIALALGLVVGGVVLRSLISRIEPQNPARSGTMDTNSALRGVERSAASAGA